MTQFFYPAIKQMNRLNYPFKMALIGLIFCTPLAIVIPLLISEYNEWIVFAEKERAGIAYIIPLKKLISSVQQSRERGATLSDNNTAEELLDPMKKIIDQDIEALDAVDEDLGAGLATTEKWKDIQLRLASLRSPLENSTPSQSFASHTAMLKNLSSHVTYIADTSQLNLDPYLDTYYLMDTVVNKLPTLSEYLSQARFIVLNAKAAGGLTQEQRDQLRVLSGYIVSVLYAVDGNMRTIFAQNPRAKNQLFRYSEMTSSNTKDSLDILNRNVIPQTGDPDQAVMFDASSLEALTSISNMNDATMETLDILLGERIKRLNTKKYWVEAVTVLVLIALAYLLTGFYLSVITAVRRLETASKGIAEGDFSGNFTLEARDEMSRIGKGLKDMAAALAQSREALLESTARYESVLDTVGEAIITIDAGGTIVMVNQAVQKIWGYENYELVGNNVKVLMPEQYREAHAAGLNNYINTRVGHMLGNRWELKGLKKDGTSFPLEILIAETNVSGRLFFTAAVRDITDRKKAEEEIKRLARFPAENPGPVLRITRDGIIDYANKASSPLLQAWNCALGGEVPNYIRKLVINTLSAGNNRDIEFACAEQTFLLTFSPATASGYVNLYGTDISGLKRAEALLVEEKERAEVTLQSIGDAVITTDALGKVGYLNAAAEQLTGWFTKEAQGKQLLEVFNIVNETTKLPAENPIEKVALKGRIIDISNQTTLIRRDGQELFIDHSAAPILDRSGCTIGVVLVFHDVTQERKLKLQLSYQAKHDSLTGLVNRREFETRLEQLLITAQQENRHHAMCYLDLDQFKIVNDTCGHAAGDQLLWQLTSLLRGKVRDSDLLARLGGDEFGVLLENCPVDQALRIAEELRQTVKDFHFVWQDKSFTIGVSIGMVPITASSESLTAVLSAADTACYVAKDKGRNRVHVYLENDSEAAQRHGEMQWVARINQALEERRFRLYNQEISPIGAGALNGAHYEILIRMVGENGSIVPPMAFIPAAERYNLMSAIDRWVVRNTFQHLSLRNGRTNKSELYSINLSGQSLGDDHFLEFVVDEFAQTKIEPTNVCFEITETAAIANFAKAMQFIATLRAMGCRFALDDFGSGLSSFAYLKNLSVDYLKIDGRFVQDMQNDPVDYAMVEAINNIGHLMGIKTIAEFVENTEVLELLKDLRVDFAQGFTISKPFPIESAELK